MLKLLIGLTAFYLSMTAVVFLKQRTLLYQPSNHGLTLAQAQSLTLKHWPEFSTYLGYLNEPPNAKLTVVVFHGNAGEAANRIYYLRALAPFNARVLLVEYPGYGGHSGSPSENAFVEHARSTLKLVAETYPYEPIIIIGESMGTGVAAAALNPEDDIEIHSLAIQGLILITPWDSLANLAQTHYWYLPARWLVLDRYDSVKNLQSFKAPKAIVVAKQDKVIPEKHGIALFANIPSSKALFELDSGHNDWINHVDTPWWKTIMDFIADQK